MSWGWTAALSCVGGDAPMMRCRDQVAASGGDLDRVLWLGPVAGRTACRRAASSLRSAERDYLHAAAKHLLIDAACPEPPQLTDAVWVKSMVVGVGFFSPLAGAPRVVELVGVHLVVFAEQAPTADEQDNARLWVVPADTDSFVAHHSGGVVGVRCGLMMRANDDGIELRWLDGDTVVREDHVALGKQVKMAVSQ
jgi:hypothetical protein